MFDSTNYALLGRLPVQFGSVFVHPQDLVRLGADRLALLTNTRDAYLLDLSAIRL